MHQSYLIVVVVLLWELEPEEIFPVPGLQQELDFLVVVLESHLVDQEDLVVVDLEQEVESQLFLLRHQLLGRQIGLQIRKLKYFLEDNCNTAEFSS